MKRMDIFKIFNFNKRKKEKQIEYEKEYEKKCADYESKVLAGIVRHVNNSIREKRVEEGE
jgi:hypothetical protein